MAQHLFLNQQNNTNLGRLDACNILDAMELLNEAVTFHNNIRLK